MPKSVIQTSQGLTPGIVVLHVVEHHRSLQSRLIAGRDIWVLVGEIERCLANGPLVRLRELG